MEIGGGHYTTIDENNYQTKSLKNINLSILS